MYEHFYNLLKHPLYYLKDSNKLSLLSKYLGSYTIKLANFIPREFNNESVVDLLLLKDKVILK